MKRSKKVYSKWKKSQNSHNGYRATAKIVLEGDYLISAGFNPNDHLVIRVEQNEIVIKKASS